MKYKFYKKCYLIDLKLDNIKNEVVYSKKIKAFYNKVKTLNVLLVYI